MPETFSPPVTLADHFLKRGVAKDTIASLFANLLLPVPPKNYYFTTSDNGAIIYLNPCGIVIRLSLPDSTSDKEEKKFDLMAVSHPAVLEPLATFRYMELQVDIMPGIRLGHSYDDLHELKRKLAADGYDLWDVKSTGNIGYLPMKTAQYPNGIPVVLDRNAVRKIENFDHSAPLTIDPEYLQAQEQFRQALPKFDTAGLDFPRGADKEKMGAFWRDCMDAVKDGVLQAGWMHKDFSDVFPQYAAGGDTARAQRVSKRYEPLLHIHWRNNGIDVPAPPGGIVTVNRP